MEKTIKRAELERVFGGMAAKTYHAGSDWVQMTPEERARFKAMSPDEVEAMSKQYEEDWIEYEALKDIPIANRTPVEKAKLNYLRAQGQFPFYGTARWEADAKLEMEITDTVAHQRHDEVRKLAHGIVLNAPLDRTSKLYRALAEIKAYESFRVLLGSGIASIPEAGGIFLRAKGTLKVTDFTKNIFRYMTDEQWRGDMTDAARLLGVLREGAGAAIATELTSQEVRDTQKGFFGKHLPLLFKWNGNDAVVNMTRVLASDTGKDFILTQAGKLRKLQLVYGQPGVELFDENDKLSRELGLNDKAWMEHQAAKDWLAELGIHDHNAVIEWGLAGQPAWSPSLDTAMNANAKAVQEAIITFVNEAVLNPKASERPLWMDSMWGQMAGHLKSFMYAYLSVIIGGFNRELSRRWDRGEDISEQMLAWQLALPFVLTTMAVFAVLGALSEEIRQRIFSFGERGGLQRAGYDPAEYLVNISDRAGFLQLPFFDALLHTDKGMGALTYQAGPAAHHLYELQDMLLKEDPQIQRAMMKSIPVLSQLPTVRRGLYEDDEPLDEGDIYASSRP
jgi:hypothetical protein